MKSNDEFFKGLMFGAVAGAVAALLLAPKSGEETRKDIKKLAKDTGDKVEGTYRQARDNIQSRIDDLKRAGDNVDIDVYKSIVATVVDDIKSDGEVTAQAARKLREKLNEDWQAVKSSLQEE